jgi:aminomethyltransferase
VAHCDFDDESDKTALIALQGPRAFEVLAQLPDADPAVAALEPFHFCDATLAGRTSTVSRTGYTGEDGVEIFCAWDDAPALWRALLEAGKQFGLRPIGLGARDTLRLEACLSLYGNEIDETTNPLEAGLGWIVKMGKGDFVGREALLRTQERPLGRKLVGFVMVGKGIARHGYPLRDPAALDSSSPIVGVCTSGSPAPTVGKNIGLGYLPTAMSEIGTRLLVDCRGKSVEAVVAKTPFYKRTK